MTFPLVTTNISRLLAFALIFASLTISWATEPIGIKWEKELGPAKARAVVEKKPMILHFYFDGCAPCQLMERDILSNPNVIEKVNSNFVAVKINTTQSPQLMTQYDVIMAPTDVYLSPDGQIVHTRGGRATFDQFVTEITQVAAKYPKPQPPVQQVQQTQIAQYQPQPAYNQPVPQSLQGQPANFAGYHVTDSVNQMPQYQPTTPSPLNDSEGFAVSGQSRVPQNAAVTAQLQQLQQHQMPQQQIPQQPMAVTLQPMIPPPMQVAPMQVAQSPMPERVAEQTIQQPVQQQNFVASAMPASAVGGTFENGIVHRQPVAGLGAGTSLGVVAVVNNQPTASQLSTIALDGYCPVSLSQTAKWVKGNTGVTTEYEGVIFRFVSIDAKNAFVANPALYAPVLRGNDIVELTTTRREVPGLRKFGAWYRGQVYLFTNAENYATFQNNPELYAFQAKQAAGTLAANLSVSQ